MPLLLECQHAVGVVGQLADQEDFQTVRGAQRVGALAQMTVPPDLVDEVADRRVKAQRRPDAVVHAKRIDATDRLLHQLVALRRMVHPFTADAPAANESAQFTQARPVQALEIVGFEFVALDPAALDAPVHALHELQRDPGDLARCFPTGAVMPWP